MILSAGLALGAGCAAGILPFVPLIAITIIVSVVALFSGAKTLYKIIPVLLSQKKKRRRREKWQRWGKRSH